MLNTLLLAALAAAPAVMAGPVAPRALPVPIIGGGPRAESDVHPPKALPATVRFNEAKFQPAMDFDTDSCYNVPAIDADGNIVKGLSHTSGLTAGCRDASDLDNNNVYVRRRCNNGWCAYLYDYYFEKDVAVPFGGWSTGHRHDWEHIVVWVRGDHTPEYVAISQHGDYEIKKWSDIRNDGGTHPKIVYHKHGPSTHCFRFANKADDDKLENHKGVWFYGALVDYYDGWPVELRNKLVNHDFGSATIAFKDSQFMPQLDKAKPDDERLKAFKTGRDGDVDDKL